LIITCNISARISPDHTRFLIASFNTSSPPPVMQLRPQPAHPSAAIRAGAEDRFCSHDDALLRGELLQILLVQPV
jgi:hypothetical protein